MPNSTEEFAIVDSHIHLYAEFHLKNLNWSGGLPIGHVLNRQNSVEDYQAAIQGAHKLIGFVFLETDQKSGLEESLWTYPLEEIEFLARIRGGVPKAQEGHCTTDKDLVLGIVPWAPIAGGKSMVQQYLAKAKVSAATEDVWQRVKGFRYLVQDKPKGTLLKPEFIEGLQVLKESGIRSFDLGVDSRQGGLWQLLEACEMLDRYYHHNIDHLNIIINHMCKPNLRLTLEEVQSGNQEFSSWAKYIRRLAAHPTTFMKLSGLFSELPTQDADNPTSIQELVAQTKPWVDVVFSSFGSRRVLFGSDWPVCNVGGPGRDKSWEHWHNLVVAILLDQKLTNPEKQNIWSRTAIKAYGLDISTS